MSVLADALRDIADWISQARSELMRLEGENTVIRLRTETAEKEAAEAYAKGQRDMKLAARMAMCEADTPFRSYDEVWVIAQEAVNALPVKERP